jgi:hypothetical protein
MNIFASNKCPTLSAQVLDDKRVVKMILESAQILCTAMHIKGVPADKIPYKPTHINHPCVKCAADSRGNYIWLFKHYIALCSEYYERYHKTHKCYYFKELLETGASRISEGDFYTPCNCTTYKDIDDVYTAYKLYLSDKWKNDKRKPTWGGKNEGYLRIQFG